MHMFQVLILQDDQKISFQREREPGGGGLNDLKHLGHMLQSNDPMTIDCNKRRAIFISTILF